MKQRHKKNKQLNLQQQMNLEEQYILQLTKHLGVEKDYNTIKKMLDEYREKALKRNKFIGPINVYEIGTIIYLVCHEKITLRTIANVTNTTEMTLHKYKKIINNVLKVKINDKCKHRKV